MLATRDEIHQIIYNLTDNAVKYTPPGSTVQVSLFREGDQVVLTVENTGARIPAEALPHLFEAFYRAEPSRSRATSSGLLKNVTQILRANEPSFISKTTS